MQTFKQFLAEGRSKPVAAARATEWMREHAMGYLGAGTFLYRGIREGEGRSVLHANSGDGEPRKSIGGMANYYTLWMSRGPEWKGKPRRERSFIVSSSLYTAKSWGMPHLVVPADSSAVGAVGANDIWNREVAPGLRIAKLTSLTKGMFKRFDLDQDVAGYDELADNLKAIKVKDLLDETDKQAWHFEPEMIKALRGYAPGTMYDVWRDLLDPKKFDFMTPRGITTAITRDDGEEMWIDGEALFIPISVPPEDAEHLLSWAGKHAPALESELNRHWK